MDIAVIGAGAIGAACARELADRGHMITVYDAGVGRAAGAFAAAGILHPTQPHCFPEAFHVLRRRGEALWHEWMSRYPTMEIEQCGIIGLDDDPGWRHWREREGFATVPIQWAGEDAWLFPEVMCMRTPRMAPALLDGIPQCDADIADPTELLGTHERVVVAAGAWMQALLGDLAPAEHVAPRKGQLLRFDRGEMPHAVWSLSGKGLAVARHDGSVVVGVTLEAAGFDPTLDDAVADALEAFARRYVPGLGARVDHWAGFRPWSPRAVPTIGFVHPRIVIATGHHRNGILLAPSTAELVADLIDGRAPAVDPTPYRPRS